MKYFKYLTLFILTNLLLAQSKTESTWLFDKSHSKIGFSVKHLMITEVEGFFKDYDGKVVTNREDFENAQIEFIAETASIFTDNERRDEHLRSNDFFNSENYPKMTFRSKSFKKVGKNKYKLTGDLTIREITKPITLDVIYNGSTKDPWGNTKAGFTVTGQLNRFDYNLKWNALTELGGAVVDRIVKLKINVQLVKQNSL